MALIFTVDPPGGRFVEFVRIRIFAEDDGASPTINGPTDAYFTLDGALPTNPPTGTTIKRRLPIHDFPITAPGSLKIFVVNQSTGAGTVTASGTTVTGTGTAFLANIAVGNKIIIRGQTRTVATVPLDISLTVTVAFSPAIGSASTYIIERTSATSSFYFNIKELSAKNEIRVIPENVRNYTLKVTEGDLARSASGGYNIVFGPDKTVQDIRESILVENVPQNKPPGDRTLPNFGSALNRILGEEFPVGFAASEIQSTIFSALAELVRLQQENRVPTEERIAQVLYVRVVALDEVTFKYNFAVKTVGGQEIPNSGIIRGS